MKPNEKELKEFLENEAKNKLEKENKNWWKNVGLKTGKKRRSNPREIPTKTKHISVPKTVYNKMFKKIKP